MSEEMNNTNEVEEVIKETVEKTTESNAVEIEPLFEEMVDFDTFSKSDFRVVKVKECSAVKKSKKLLHFVLDDGTGTDRCGRESHSLCSKSGRWLHARCTQSFGSVYRISSWGEIDL